MKLQFQKTISTSKKIDKKNIVLSFVIVVFTFFLGTYSLPINAFSKKSCIKKSADSKKQIIPEKQQFDWPLEKDRFWISCYFDKEGKHGRVHLGLDLAAFEGTPVYAIGKGEVEEARTSDTWGNTIYLEHPNSFHSRYAHLSKMLVKKNDKVEKGMLIGYVGKSGRTKGKNGEHLHFEILKNRIHINPYPLLP